MGELAGSFKIVYEVSGSYGEVEESCGDKTAGAGENTVESANKSLVDALGLVAVDVEA